MDLIEGEDLNALEARVDAWRASIAIPSWTLERARWNLLSVTEDSLRLRVLSVRRGAMEIEQYQQLIDDQKYTLKYALAHVAGLLPAPLRDRPNLNEETEYKAALGLLKAHDEFNDAMAAFSGARAGTVRCYRQPDGRYWFRNAGLFERQANDIIESRTAISDATPLALIFQFLFADDDELPSALARCVRRLRTSTSEYRPRIGEEVIDELDAILGARRTVIPPNWSSSLGTGVQLARSFRTLSLVAVAHIVAVSNAALGAARNQQPNGWHVRWLLGEATANWLTNAMGSRGGVSMVAARELLQLLTYGSGTTSPDPALQFFFPLRAGLIAIPWFVYATCNAQRNFLALLARARRQEFNAASDAFEDNMVADLREALRGKSWRSRISSFIPGERAAGEVDVILLDPQSSFVLVVELRWFLEPSEVTEVVERERAGREKAAQARRKREAARRALTTILAEEGIDTSGVWTVEAIAVFDNYLPTPQEEDLPFASFRAFVSGIDRESHLRRLYEWIRLGDWLPRRDEHFLIQPVEARLGDLVFQVDGLNPTAAGEQFILDRDASLLRRWSLL
jgi:hypothetical protein